MDNKLTLKLKRNTIQKAKRYARKKNASVSRMVENYLEKVTDEPQEIKGTPLVNSLHGVVHLPEKFDHKKEYTTHLIKKYK